MKKVICINANMITINNLYCYGTGLVKDKEYTVLGETVDDMGLPLYVIHELNETKLAMRFMDVDDYKKEEETENTIEELLEEISLN